MAYVSNESGPPEVYVQSYPRPGEKIRISTNVGYEPIWTRNGREILYRSSTRDGEQPLYQRAIRSLSPFQFDPPRRLFTTRPGEFDSTDAHPRLGRGRRRPTLPDEQADCHDRQARNRDARRAQLGRRFAPPRAGPVVGSEAPGRPPSTRSLHSLLQRDGQRFTPICGWGPLQALSRSVASRRRSSGSRSGAHRGRTPRGRRRSATAPHRDRRCPGSG